LLALLAANEVASTAVQRGVRYLIETQSPDGQWEEPQFTGTGFPRDFMLKYHLYRNYWPLWALGRYRRLCEGRAIHLPGLDPLA
jgi:squalene-hopene/tetraprenyl-beta-curcumene cyclase